MRRAWILRWSLPAALLFLCSCAGQPVQKNSDFVDIKSIDPSIHVDVRYATKNNFTKQKLYNSDRCFLRRGTALKLSWIQEELKRQGLGLKIFDGYRPLSVQKKMWEKFPDENYVANPAAGSFHNRGAAVDVTLVTSDGRDLPMGTGYDDFTEKAHLDCKTVPKEARRNRWILVSAMLKNGFLAHRTEWWHYTDKNWRLYKIEDRDFSRE